MNSLSDSPAIYTIDCWFSPLKYTRLIDFSFLATTPSHYLAVNDMASVKIMHNIEDLAIEGIASAEVPDNVLFKRGNMIADSSSSFCSFMHILSFLLHFCRRLVH